MNLRLDIKIPAYGGIELGAWPFLPEGSDLRPAITTAQGYAGNRAHGLKRFDGACAETGFVAPTPDHRNFGISVGAHRGDINPWQQSADWRRTILYLEAYLEIQGGIHPLSRPVHRRNRRPPLAPRASASPYVASCRVRFYSIGAVFEPTM